MTTVYLHTFGCKANQYDTEVVRQSLESAGVRIVDDPAVADAAVVNSCTVTHTGEAKMRGLVRRLARARPGIETVVMGCAAALDDGTIANLPGVTHVVAGADTAGVLRALRLAETPVDRVLRRFDRGSRAWLKIQDGCDEHCTFCATTLARGANRSRPADELVEEARLLAEQCAEIVVTGVHIGAYGRDRGERDGLGRLLDRLIASVPDVRFRLSSVEATELDDWLVALMSEAPERLAPHIHAPLQSGSDRVLRRMGRHWYTAASYRARLEDLANRVPFLGLGADIIVGFPGETAADFRATEALVDALPFTYAHVFPYSERPDAAARRLGPPVSPGTMRDRADRLRARVAAKREAYLMTRHGTMADLVVLRRRAGVYEALSEDYLTVALPAEGPLEAARLRARIGCHGTTLTATLQPV